MKQPPKSQRPSSRYLKFRIHGESPAHGELERELWKAALDYLGEKEAAATGLSVPGDLYSGSEGKGVIRVRAGAEEDVRAALTLNPPDGCFLEVTGTSGTLKGL